MVQGLLTILLAVQPAPQTCNIVLPLPGVALQSTRCERTVERTCEPIDFAVSCGVTCETPLACWAITQRAGRVGCWDQSPRLSRAARVLIEEAAEEFEAWKLGVE